MKITIYDEEPSKNHDLVCATIVFLNTITAEGATTEKTIELTHKGKIAGKIKLNFEFKAVS